ncbi:MAG: type II secretion system F family protein [Candidatus Roizmanbacteria bacterium]
MNLSTSFGIVRTISLQDKVFFTKHLSVMLKSGISISEAISSLEAQTSSPYLKRILTSLSDSVLNGQRLERSLARFPDVFDSFYLYMIKVGEETGNLEKNLEYLAVHLKKDADFKKKVFSASLYPSIVIATAVIVGGGTSLFILPRLITLFKSLDVVIPLSTRILLFFAQTMKDFGIYIMTGIFALYLLAQYLVGIPRIKNVWERFTLSLPYIGLFIQSVELSQFCRNMGIMLSSGLPISQALSTQIETTTNLEYRKIISIILDGVEKGESITQVLDGNHFAYFPAIAISMISVGEKTGKLNDSFTYLGDFFEDEVDNTTKNLTTIFEPILLLVVGLIVAFLAIAIISPIYQFTGSIKR